MTPLKSFDPELGRPQTVARRIRIRNPRHSIEPELIVTLHGDGQIGLKEYRRPKSTEQLLDLGELYAKAVNAAVLRSIHLVRQYKKTMTLKDARHKARRECHLT